MADPKIQGMCFLDLPTELRIDSYRYVLSTPARIVPTRTDRFPQPSATVPAQLLTCCKTISNEARPIFFEVTDFALKEPRDLLRLKAYVGRFAATISRLTFSCYSMINKTRIKELRAFKSLRAVGFGAVTSMYSGVDFNDHPQQQLEPLAMDGIGGEDSQVTELVRQRPSLTYTVDVQAMRYGADLNDRTCFLAKVEVTLPDNAVSLVPKFVTLLRVTEDGEMVKEEVQVEQQS